MASGDIACSTPTFCETDAAIETAVDLLNLAAATDNVHIIPWRTGALVFKTERTA